MRIAILLFSFLFSLASINLSRADEFNQIQIGIGYGPQLSNQFMDQHNGSLDIFYNFYQRSFKSNKRWDFTLGAGYTYLNTNVEYNEHIHVATVLPSLQYNFSSRKTWQPFFRIGVGPGYMSSNKLGYRRQGSNWVFNTFIGLGLTVGTKKDWELIWIWRHLSNGRLNLPNPGIDVPYSLHLAKRI